MLVFHLEPIPLPAPDAKHGPQVHSASEQDLANKHMQKQTSNGIPLTLVRMHTFCACQTGKHPFLPNRPRRLNKRRMNGSRIKKKTHPIIYTQQAAFARLAPCWILRHHFQFVLYLLVLICRIPATRLLSKHRASASFLLASNQRYAPFRLPILVHT